MPLSESRRRANDKYIAKSWSRIALSMPNDEAAALRQYCADHGLAIAGFIRSLIRDAISAGASGAAGPGATHGGIRGIGQGGVSPPNNREE